MSDTPTMNEKEMELSQIIKKLWSELKDLGLGLPLQVVFSEVKKKGLYQSDYFIAEKMRKFEKMGLIRVENWNIKEINLP